MVPPKATVLPPISLLPSTDPCFVRAVDDVALIAGGLIASVDAALLTIAVPGNRWNDDLPLIAWSQRLVASVTLADALGNRPVFAPAFRALRMAVDVMFDRLETWRWSHIDAPGLCLVTDGVGIVLSTARPPSTANCGWLLDLARPENGAITVRPPDANGAWSLIAAETGTLH